ncbi:hypothetical protein ACKI2N_019250 [Cupriavidus sp. 30B13]|uniref:hypothetical protein n=1 Tax=Cupriavidus sp. 30B13 TaxID=3384241 RepID=UPI003B906709
MIRTIDEFIDDRIDFIRPENTASPFPSNMAGDEIAGAAFPRRFDSRDLSDHGNSTDMPFVAGINPSLHPAGYSP